jgi:type IX secretion system PorP/SprF family membrane protein
MKRTKALTLLLFLVAANAWSQQLPQYTNYMLNQFGLNPAAVPQNSCVDAKFGYRQQWIGFDGSPNSQFFSITAFLTNKKKGYKKGKHAIGAYVESDATPPTKRDLAYLSYSYHKQLGRELWGAVGIHAGLMQYSYDMGGIVLSDPIPDPAINGNSSTFIYPEMNPGIWFYTKNMYSGLSVKNVVGNKLTGVFGYKNRLQRHIYVTYGYRFLSIGNKFSFIPSFNIKFATVSPVAVDLNFMVDYRNKIAIGLSYRNRDAVCALVRLPVGRIFTIGYAFDYTTSKIRLGSSNTHEVVLGIKFCKQKEFIEAPDICPAYH